MLKKQLIMCPKKSKIMQIESSKLVYLLMGSIGSLINLNMKKENIMIMKKKDINKNCSKTYEKKYNQ